MEWLDRQQGKLEPMLSTMRDVEQKRMRGFSVEFRTLPEDTTWPMWWMDCSLAATGFIWFSLEYLFLWKVQIWHRHSRQDNVEAMLQHGKGLELELSAILDHVEEGIQAAIDAGVFPRPGPSLQKQVPSWKILPKGVAQICLANWFAHWHCYAIDRDDGTWAPPSGLVQPPENLLNANTPLPEGMPIIRAQGNAESIRNLQKCIAAALIDWGALATAAGDQAAADC